MKVFLKKTAGAIPSEPINHRNWRELIDDFDYELESLANQETEDGIVDLWLETPQSFMGESDGEVNPPTTPTIRRIRTGGVIRRADDPRVKTASSTNWDEEFANAKAHVDQILKSF